MKFILLAMFCFSSASVFSSVLNFDAYREEIRDMTKDGHVPRTSYSGSRKIVMQQIHLKQDKLGYFVKDVYCNIQFRKKISPTTMPNANNINIEHTWPRSRFNPKETYNHQLADLHHLYPTESRSNSTRGNHYFSEFNEDGEYISDKCTSSLKGRISETGRMGFEPPDEHKGNVARTLFYFSIRYNLNIPAYEEFYLRQWDLIDPVDAQEIKRNDIVQNMQGNRNPFIDDPALAQLIRDF